MIETPDARKQPASKADGLHPRLDLFAATIGIMRNGVTISDVTQPDCPLIYANAGFEALTGYTRQEVIGRNCRFLQGEERQQDARPIIRSAVAAGEFCRTIIRNYRKDGSAFWNELSLYPLLTDNGKPAYYIGIQYDITEIVERSKHLIQVERKSAHEAAQHAQSMTLLNEMSRKLDLALGEAAIYHITAHYTPQIVQADWISVALLDPNGSEFEIRVLYGEAGTIQPGLHLPRQADAQVDIGHLQASLANHLQQQGMASRISAPLMAAGALIGTLNVASKQTNAFTQRDEHLLLQIASLLASNVQSQRLFAQTQAALEESKEYAHRLALLNEMGQQMGMAADEAQIFQIVTQFARQIVPSDRVSISLLSDDGLQVEVFALQGSVGLFPLGVRLPTALTLVGKAIVAKQARYTPDLRLCTEIDARTLIQDGLLSSVVTPIIVGSRAIGALNVNRKSAAAYREQEISLSRQIAAFLGTTIDNTRLYNAAREQNVALLSALDQLHNTQAQLIAAEKMAALGRLVAGLAHEINTPIGIAVTAASVWEDHAHEIWQRYQNNQMQRADFEAFLQISKESGKLLTHNLQRAAELIQSFKQVAIDQSSEAARVINLTAYLREVVASLQPELKRSQLTIQISGDETIVLKSYPGALSQIMTNLIINSLIHAYEPADAGRLTITVSQQNARACLTYTDDGKGIPSEHQDKIFEPFFTTHRGQGGSGLGLHIVYNLVTQKLGGDIWFQSQVGVGTTFTITLPLQIGHTLPDD